MEARERDVLVRGMARERDGAPPDDAADWNPGPP